MPPPSKHRLGPPRSSNLSRGVGTLSQHRGAAPEDKGSRLNKTGSATRSSKARFLKAPTTTAIAEAPRALLAPPKKTPTPKAPLPPPAPKTAAVVPQAAPRPTLRSMPAPVVIVAPPPPAKEPPVKMLTNTDRDRLFGHFNFKAAPSSGNPERILVDPSWAAEHIVTITSEPLARVEFPSPDPLTPPAGILGLPPHGIELHKLVAPHFEELIAAWDAEKLLPLIKTWNGSYVPRFRRGQAAEQVLSAHSWGSAFDINARWNAFKQVPAALGAEGSVRALVAIANKLGWMWGGDFSSPDGMHFEASAELFPRTK
jgi:hypothetical protein